jgi:hypothetical protein
MERDWFKGYPLIKAVPEDGVIKVVNIFIRVVLPAPLGPNKPKSSPGLTKRLTSDRAGRGPSDFEINLRQSGVGGYVLQIFSALIAQDNSGIFLKQFY